MNVEDLLLYVHTNIPPKQHNILLYCFAKRICFTRLVCFCAEITFKVKVEALGLHYLPGNTFKLKAGGPDSLIPSFWILNFRLKIRLK